MKVTSKILITGGSGFVGRALIRALSSDFPEMEIHNLSPSPVEGVVNHIIERGSISVPADLGTDFDYIVHALALSCDRYCQDFDLTEKMNVSFTKNVLHFCALQKSLKKFVHFSSIVVYDNANEPPVKETDALRPYYGNYSFTKGIAESYVEYFSEKFKIPSVILRFSNMYGPGQVFENSPFLIPEKIYQGLTEGKIVAQTDVPVRDFLYIDDAIDAIDLVLFSDCRGIFNVAGGNGVSVGEVVSEISEQLGVPYSFIGSEARGPIRFFADIAKIRTAVGWSPKIALKEGLSRTIEWISKASRTSSPT